MLICSSRSNVFVGIVNRPVRSLAMCIFVSFLICCFIALSPLSSDGCHCPGNHEEWKMKQDIKGPSHFRNTKRKGNHKLAVLVPFRDRFEELLQFVPHMDKFLSHQHVNFRIFILNQVDNFRFNRASLINVGFLVSQEDCDYLAMHDVDLLPQNQELSYHYPRKPGPFHIASPEYHPRYHYATFVGGILLIRREDFLHVDGMSNKYWGWGLEDDEFYVRLKEAGLEVSRPTNISTGTEDTFLHIHDRAKRKRDMAKCFNQREITRRRDKETGLHNVDYSIDSQHDITVDGATATIVNIKLNCNRQLTPWCSCNSEKIAIRQPSEVLQKPVEKLNNVIVPNVKKTVKFVTRSKKK